MNSFSQTNPRKDAFSTLIEILIIVTITVVHSVLPGTLAAEKPEIANPKIVWIPPGTFKLGSPSNEVGLSALERQFERQWTVKFTRGFFMAKHEVTQGEFLALMEYNPSYFSINNDFSEDLERPVESVTWNEALEYCAKLNEVEEAAGRLPPGWEYRLPKEAEWEYACRAGTTTSFHHGPDLRSGMANFNGRNEYVQGVGTVTNQSGIFSGKPTRVGSYKPNAWGLYDMHGNVAEMCSFVGNPTDRIPFALDPPGVSPWTRKDLAGSSRGGAFLHRGLFCRSGYTGIFRANERSRNSGFRPVLAPVQVQTPMSFSPPTLYEGQLVIFWTGPGTPQSGPGTLQSADTVTGPWTDVESARWALAAPIREPAKFYRLRE